MGRNTTMRAAWFLALFVAVLGTTNLAQAQAQATPISRRDRVYLTELAFVLEGARRVLLFGEAHGADPELARFAYPLSEHYVELAGRMTPGDKLKIFVHPHLLLVIENVERALSAASQGDQHAFRQHVRTTREELSTLEAVLKHLKVRLPETMR